MHGQQPPLHFPYLPVELQVEAIDRSFQAREHMLNLLKYQLQRVVNRMKQLAYQQRSERSFKVGDWVYLKLQPFRENSAAMRSNKKLAPKYYGPCQIEGRV